MRWTSLVTAALFACAPVELALSQRSPKHAGTRLAQRGPEKPHAPRGHQPPGSELRKLKRAASSGSSFLNEKTRKFVVNGSAIPEVDFDVGESYAGLMPISDDPDEDAQLYFWFFPSANAAADKEILIWLNGGPGCSSLEGFLQENGPFLWQYGTYKPVQNPWSWHTLTNIVWVEQPVGTGFTQGKVTATSEEDVAAQFLGFWKKFMEAFGMQGYKVYIAGESYAGMFCPYIASAMLDQARGTYFDLQGMLIYDPSISQDDLLEPIPIVKFTDYWAGLFPFNDSFRADIKARDAACGYSAYVDEYLVYPPKGQQPSDLPGAGDMSCRNIYTDVWQTISQINPCFDIYQVATTCPLLWDVLGFPGSFGYLPDGATTVYFNRSDVKAAINAPADVSWAECVDSHHVFANANGGDVSPPSSLKALPKVIDGTRNVIIGHGALDMMLLANGTLLAIQNMTWGGHMGFQTRPHEPFYVPYSAALNADMSTVAGAGVFGTVHSERGLHYCAVDLSGHMVPQYAPAAAYRHVEFLLGRVDCMNCKKPFTTDPETAQSSQALGEGTAPQGWADVANLASRDDGGRR